MTRQSLPLIFGSVSILVLFAIFYTFTDLHRSRMADALFWIGPLFGLMAIVAGIVNFCRKATLKRTINFVGIFLGVVGLIPLVFLVLTMGIMAPLG